MEKEMDDNSKERPATEGRDEKGRFGPGNPGRTPGSRNKVSAAAQAVLDDSLGDVAQKCVSMALEGNTACALALLKLRIPAVREPAHEPIALPALTTPNDALAALRTIAEATANGDIDGDQARSLVTVIESVLKTFEIVDLDQRIRALETVAEGAKK
jgi:hypothetical protein